MVSTLEELAETKFSVAIIGAGPRGTSVVERWANFAHRAGRLATRLQITVFDTYRPGAGHVWRTTQSPNFWMNTPVSFPTVAPERKNDEPGLSFAQFLQFGGDGAELSPAHRAELEAAAGGSFASRSLYGRYLEHVYDKSVAVLAAHPDVELKFASAEVRAVKPYGAGYKVEYLPAGESDSPQSAVKELSVDAVVLALGHQPAELNPQQRHLQVEAEQAMVTYIPPNIPSDVDYTKFKAGQPALLRGLGLNFFDIMAELTVGRQGVFHQVSDEPGEKLEYIPSGQEPLLVAASRRGTPYWGKPVTDRFIPEEIGLQYLNAEDLIQLVAEARSATPEAALSFSRDVWPRLHRDILWAYYSQCAVEYREQLPISTQEFAASVQGILDAEHHEGVQVWLANLRDYVTGFPMIQWLDVPRLAHPFDEVGFTSHEQYQQAVREYLRHNTQCSARGLADPLSRAILTMNAGRMVVKDLVTLGLIDEQSRIEEIQARFEPLVEGLASGPPLERIEQLLALSRSGIISFVGPEPKFEFDPLAGEFTASSPWVDSEGHTARVLCESMMPANRVLQNNAPLIKQMLADKVARVHQWRNSDGELLPGSGFDVVGEPYRIVDGDGLAHRGLFALGLQLSSAQWGTAIAAQAGDVEDPAARTLVDAHLIVNELARLSGLGLSHLSVRQTQQGTADLSGAGPDYN